MHFIYLFMFSVFLRNKLLFFNTTFLYNFQFIRFYVLNKQCFLIFVREIWKFLLEASPQRTFVAFACVLACQRRK